LITAFGGAGQLQAFLDAPFFSAELGFQFADFLQKLATQKSDLA